MLEQAKYKAESIIRRQKKSPELSRFLSGVADFINSRKPHAKIGDSIKQGLDVFLKIPGAISSSLFILNEYNFDFEHKYTIPEKADNYVKEYFESLIDAGVVGHALQSSAVLLHENDGLPGFDDHCIIVPLIASAGVLGLVIALLEEIPVIEDDNYYKTCSLYGSVFASALENYKLETRLKNTREVLEQKVAARTMNLAQNKRELNSIFDSVHTGILVIDSESDEVIKGNPVAVSLIGENITGKKYTEFLDFDGAPVRNPASHGIATKNFESKLRTVAGDEIPVLRSVSLIKVGMVKFRIESFLDIRERKKAEGALKDANELLELKVQERTEELQVLVHTLKEQISIREQTEDEILKMLRKEKVLNELKTRFISMVSHEFRTPLTLIRTSAQLVEKFDNKLSNKEKNEYLQRIMKTVDFMKDLIENAIFIGQTDADKVKLKPSNVDIDDFSRQLISDLQLIMDRKREVIYQFKGDNNIAFTDPKVLRNILVNLLTNAIKYSDYSTPVEFYLEMDDEKSYFEIKDYGIGIPDKEQEHIFELFYRGANVGKVTGTGLGMSVVLRSLEAMGGTIDFKSKVNVGTTFKVTLPHLQKK